MILYRYLIREFTKPLLFTTITFGGIVMISEFFRELSYYMEKKVNFLDVFTYLACSLPWWCVQVLPVSVLLAVLFALGGLSRHNEITAIKAAGINLWRVIILFMLCGLGIGLADFSLREFIVPWTVKQAEHIRDTKIHREEAAVKTDYYNHMVALPGNARMTIGYLNTREKTMTQVVIDFFDANYVLTRQVIAAGASWDGSRWVFRDGVTRVFVDDKGKDEPFASSTGIIATPPDDFVIKKLRPEQLGTRDFIRYIERFRAIGAPVEKELIQFHQRFSSVFSHLIVMCIGIPFAVGLGSRHGKLISFTFALIFAFVYWGTQAVGQSLGENNLVSPFAAAWLGNILFGAIGSWMMANVQK